MFLRYGFGICVVKNRVQLRWLSSAAGAARARGGRGRVPPGPAERACERARLPAVHRPRPCRDAGDRGVSRLRDGRRPARSHPGVEPGEGPAAPQRADGVGHPERQRGGGGGRHRRQHPLRQRGGPPPHRQPARSRTSGCRVVGIVRPLPAGNRPPLPAGPSCRWSGRCAASTSARPTCWCATRTSPAPPRSGSASRRRRSWTVAESCWAGSRCFATSPRRSTPRS